jgi:hypothetical protein
MGANVYTTDQLITDIKLLGHVPTGNSTFSDANLARIATMEMQSSVMKQILSTRGGYYLTYTDYDIASDGLYVIPEDCTAGALENVELVQDTTIIPVNQIEESEQLSTNAPTSTSYGFFMKGNYVQILPLPNVGVARLWYTKRLSDLVLTSAAAQVVSVSGADITVSSLPSTMVAGTAIDICGDQPPFNIIGSATIESVNSLVVTLDQEVTGVEEGQWLALSDQTPVPQIPVEYRVVLAQRVVCKVYELQNYGEKFKIAQAKLQEYEEACRTLITPRVKSQTKTVNTVVGGFLAGNWQNLTNFPASRNG